MSGHHLFEARMQLFSDVRHALRQLRRAPSFTVLALTTLALGIGVTVATFTVFNAVLLRPLPYSSPERLVRIRGDLPGIGLRNISVSVPEFVRYQRNTRLLQDVAAFQDGGVTLLADGERIPLRALHGTTNLHAVLGTRALVGRTFTPDDAEATVAMISSELWRTRFGADPALVGTSIQLGERLYQVVGVIPEGLKFPPGLAGSPPDIWLPRAISAAEQQEWGDRSFGVVARVREGATLAAAREDLARVGRAIVAEQPDWYPARLRWTPIAVPVPVEVSGSIRPMLQVMMGAVALVLLIACANVANLLLARAAARRAEVAVRLAIGGARGQILRQQLTESLTLSVLGGMMGMLIAWTGVRLTIRVGGTALPWLAETTIDWRVALFVVLVVALTGVLFGLAPALAAVNVPPGDSLKAAARGMTGVTHHRSRSSLVVAQTALAVLLLSGAGLLVRSFVNVINVDPGFEPEQLSTIRVSAPQARFADTTAARVMYRDLFERIAALPGVIAVSSSHILPLTGEHGDRGFAVEGKPVAPGDAPFDEQVRVVGPGYFATMGMTLLEGRGIEAADVAGSELVVVVNEAFARKIWPGERAVGKRVAVNGMDRPVWRTVVGVVGNLRHDGLDRPVLPDLYVPLLQSPFSWREQRLVVRSATAPAVLEPLVRRAILEANPGEPRRALIPVTRLLSETLALRRFLMLLLAAFSLVAAALASIGLYGLTSVLVQQRTSELGIRMALGAQRWDVVRLIVGRGALLVSLGLVGGLALAAALARVLRSQLMDITPADPLTMAAVATLIGLAGLLASYAPARRAASIDPARALRGD